MNIKKIFETMEYGPAPESPKAALDWLKKHNNKFGYYSNGKWETPSTKKYFPSVNPSNKEVLAEIAHAGEKDVNKAVKAAKKALPKWVKLGAHGRARYLYAMARQIQKNARLFAVLESMDNGKPIRESRDIDIPLVARHFYHHAGWAQLMDTELKDYKELGVIGQIIPWNFPLLMLAWKIAPALAMGNTVVLKPAEFTSLTALLFAEICDQIGLPAGVVNIVTGEGDTGAAIVKHPDVDKIAFTGSTEVGKIIRKATAGSGKKLSLELGGKSPFIVFEDADLDSVVEGIVDAIWFNQGQVCCAGSRLLVQESVADALYKKIKARMKKLRVGDALDKCIDMGAVVDQSQLKTITKLVKQGIAEGGEVYQATERCPTEGFYYPPTLFTDVQPSSSVAQVEIFGPVLVAMTFRTHAEAIKLANNTRYGLAASIWTDNINLALEVAPKIKAGVVWINCTNVFDAAAGFGGYRESGFGREGGKEGLYEYMKPRINDSFAKEPFLLPQTKDVVTSTSAIPAIDKTAKMYIGGKQVRPDGGYTTKIYNPNGQYVGDVSEGNRKDIRNAVEAAHKNTSWGGKTGHARAQVLYFIAENLAYRKQELAERIAVSINVKMATALEEVELSIQRIYYYAAMADKYDGNVHHTISRNVTLAMPEAIGVMAVICPNESPLLGFISAVIPAITMGNNVVVVPSETAPLLATDFYQILETSDVPAGTVNIVTGNQAELAAVLAKHDDVDGIWYFGNQKVSAMIEQASTDNMKRTWVSHGKYRNWHEVAHGQGDTFLRKASQIKNIWVPYGE
ncbi:aldehyde dehydrogenase family protein [Aureispira anguillae]|uniref:Aldehyde dehydrogenase family protein n=1 Tax=Aureispira anguillae TaxID=2864201 RepID=A0A915YBK8_9BACT|nr:aldehyde dehydrogenase family protein [Aureispira anguillae]BDS10073.1 aldehyde dehydrogenase family protein [Aureispira anguillae]